MKSISEQQKVLKIRTKVMHMPILLHVWVAVLVYIYWYTIIGNSTSAQSYQQLLDF